MDETITILIFLLNIYLLSPSIRISNIQMFNTCRYFYSIVAKSTSFIRCMMYQRVKVEET